MSGQDWRTRGDLNSIGSILTGGTVDPIPETLKAGDRFEKPSIAHQRFAEELGFELVRDGDAWVVK